MCGIYGIVSSDKENSPVISESVYLGMHALQHRGQEGAGMVTAEYVQDKDMIKFNIHKGFGLVSEVFNNPSYIQALKGYAGIGHTRYSTTGSSTVTENLQPFYAKYHSGNLAVAHNGNLSNAKSLRKELIKEGVIFNGTSDTEVILHLIARSRKPSVVEQVKDALSQIDGAYSLVILSDHGVIAARDPRGFRPLVLGGKQLDNGKMVHVVASETCAFDIAAVTYIRDIEPGEIVLINDTLTRTFLPHNPKRARCIFEYVYFSRPDSMIFGHSVDKVRRKLGKNLAVESPVLTEDKATVISVPDSSNTSALGFVSESQKNNIPAKLEIGLIRNHYTGRTFITPSETDRAQKVRSKFNIVRGVLQDRCIVMVDDSIVRGTTAKELVRLVKEGKPKELHCRIASPPIISPCYYGIDISSSEKLIAFTHKSDVNSIANYFGFTSLRYLSTKKLLESVPTYENEETSYCTGCFTGNYPTPIDDVTHDKNEND